MPKIEEWLAINTELLLGVMIIWNQYWFPHNLKDILKDSVSFVVCKLCFNFEMQTILIEFFSKSYEDSKNNTCIVFRVFPGTILSVH